MTDWKPISDEARSGETILVYGGPDDPCVFTASWDYIDRVFVLSGGSWHGPFINPTHWMPLPDPPSE